MILKETLVLSENFIIILEPGAQDSCTQGVPQLALHLLAVQKPSGRCLTECLGAHWQLDILSAAAEVGEGPAPQP